MTQNLSWGELVGEMLARRLRISQLAPGMFPETLPGIRATDADVSDASRRLGFDMDSQHENVLREANGWPDVFAYGDLLATSELGAGPRWKRAEALLASYYEDGPATGFPPREHIYPIHVADNAVFVIDRSGPVTDGGQPVSWLSDELLGQWPNVYEYWLAGLTMLDRLTARVTSEIHQGRE